MSADRDKFADEKPVGETDAFETTDGIYADENSASAETADGIHTDINNMRESVPKNYIDRDPVFYYSRERRLDKASPEVRALNDGKPIRPGLKNTLFAFKGNVMVFMSLIAICAMFAMSMLFSARDSGVKLGRNTVNMTITSVEGVLVLEVNKTTPESGEMYTGAVDIAVSPVKPKPEEGDSGDLPPMFAHSIVFRPADSETFRLALPFEGDDFFVIIRTAVEQKTMRLNVK